MEKFILRLRYTKDKYGVSKTFSSTRNLKEVMSILRLNLYKGNDVEVKVEEPKGRKTKSFRIEFVEENGLESLRDDILKIEDVAVILKGKRYRVVVDNNFSKRIEKRSFVTHYDGGLLECKEYLEKKFQKMAKEEIDEDIVFKEKINRMTHSVTIYNPGSYKPPYKTKSFSLMMPNYSSEEIVEKMRGRLEDGE
jgi:hypothetical protein